MNILDEFISFLCGEFENKSQIEEEGRAGAAIHPIARHINSVCNEKMINIPEDFKGYFVIEESYYTIGTRKNILPHLFLFNLNEEGNVVLSSYEIPEGITKEEFTNSNKELKLDYDKLVKSEKFTPMVYKREEGKFIGESLSTFGPGVTFELKECTTKDKLYVSEVFKKDGKITFGFEEPIIYERIK